MCCTTMYVAVSVMLLLLLKLTLPSISRRLRGGGLSSITSCQPKGMLTLLPATGLPPVVLTLQQAGQQVGSQQTFWQVVSVVFVHVNQARCPVQCSPCGVVRPQQSAIPAELQTAGAKGVGCGVSRSLKGG